MPPSAASAPVESAGTPAPAYREQPKGRAKAASAARGEPSGPPRARRDPTQRTMLIVLVVALLLVALSAFGAQWIRLVLLPEVAVGEKVPDFTLTSTENQTLVMRDLQGSVVIVQMFATWCLPCAAEVQALQRLLPDHPAVVVVSIDIDPSESQDQLRLYRTTHDVSWAMAVDSDTVAVRYGVTGLPMLFIVDQEQRLAHTFSGVATRADLEAALAPLEGG